MQIERRVADCAVVGAGFSGLAAADRLHHTGHDVLVLEARQRVGGRAWSAQLEDDGTVLDLGAQWVGATHDRLRQLARDQGAALVPQYDRGAKMVRAGGRVARHGHDVPLGLGPAPVAGIAAGMLRLDRMARRVPTERPWTAANAEAWDSQTLETWIRRHVRTPAARSALRGVFTGILAAEPADVSLLFALAYLHAGEGLRMLTGTKGGAQDAWLPDGMQSLAERMAANLGDRVRLGHPVRRITQRGERVTVESAALAVDASRVIVAIPPTLAGRIDFDPPLPAARDQLTQRVPQGSAIKCHVIYASPFWRTDGLSGLVLDDEGPVSMVIDGSPADEHLGVLIAFFEGTDARKASAMTELGRRAAALRCLARHFGPAALEPLHYRDQDWSAEPFTRGCYTAVMPPGVLTSYGPALRRHVGRIHWAGTETATRWTGYVEGALDAGNRAADEVRSEYHDDEEEPDR